jgi:phosphatidylinositol glycan class N
VLDAGVKMIEHAVEEFYNSDERTAYILSADHGMTDWGRSR